MINTSVSLSMAKASLPCGRERNRRFSGVAMGEIAAGLIGIVLLVSLGYALVSQRNPRQAAWRLTGAEGGWRRATAPIALQQTLRWP